MKTLKDFKKYYHLEQYLFEDVSSRFGETGELNTFDFFCIVVWKANRSKSKVANRLLGKGFNNLHSAVAALAKAIADAPNNKEKMKALINDWGLRLPMASAILSVLYPEGFSVYDVRACDVVKGFHSVQNRKFESMWTGYLEFLDAVRKSAPEKLNLRDKDRWIWGRSFAEQLEGDIERNFKKEA